MKLMGVSEIAELMAVSRQRAHQITKQADFPEPVARLAMGPIWEADDFDHWLVCCSNRKHEPRGRGLKTMSFHGELIDVEPRGPRLL
jgi:hypothetical protein